MMELKAETDKIMIPHTVEVSTMEAYQILTGKELSKKTTIENGVFVAQRIQEKDKNGPTIPGASPLEKLHTALIEQY